MIDLQATVSNKEMVSSESIYFTEYVVETDGKRTKQRYYYFPSPMNKRSRGSSRVTRNQSRSKSNSMINLPDYYRWQHDKEGKKFVSRCAATKVLYLHLGHDVKFEDPSSTASSATASSPAATTNAPENTQPSSTIATNTTASAALN